MNQATIATPSPNVRPAVRAKELATLLDEHPEIEVLSLDCFDTILWRNTAAPVDVFYDLAHRPAFAKWGINARLRVTSEGRARDLKTARTGLPEVTLAEIYRAAFPALRDADVAELAADELAAEAAACVPHPETIALIRAAAARGLSVVVVSDTYFTETELRALLAATLPADAYSAIARVFVSSAIGKPKAGGMFKPVLDALGVRARDVLHVGDNLRADYVAGKAIGMNACHLVHHGPEVEEVLRMQTTAASLLMPALRETAALPSPFRGLFAAEIGEDDRDAVRSLGYAALGPVLHAFARWLGSELDTLRAAGKRPRPIFLLRDGYLPARVCAAVAGAEVGPCVSISRFASFAASFRSAAEIERYVAAWAGGGRFLDVARQLLLTDDEARMIIARTRKAERPAEAFVREVMKPKIVELVVARSAAYRARMFAHVTTTANVEKGDTLVFVDLGYEGTAQRQLEPVFRDELGVDVQGRYLIAARVPGWQSTRKGLLDPSWCDDRLISTIVTYVALLENLCAEDAGSTIDYAADASGAPIRARSLVAKEQSARVAPVQDACERFARDAEAYFSRTGHAASVEQLRVYAASALARMLLLPTRTELDYLAGFCLDMNLGADDNLALFDRERGLEGLRRQGLFFLGSERADSKAARIAGPVELRAASLTLSLAMVAQQRFGLEMTPNDMTHRREPLGILALRGDVPIRAQVEARATHDGYFAAVVPYGAEDTALGFLLGERSAWVQVESVTRIEASALYTSRETERSEDVSAHLHAEGLTRRAPGLFECTTPEGFLLLAAPPPPKRDTRYVCRIVFRPVAPRVAA
ncbi:MAG: HAD family hydrolase [Labilithrix sp.]|nr:HAD family hydrolase [Labilithrix sp.]MCW5817181.1 HAD family hydrolase [Labilithrix sp.]